MSFLRDVKEEEEDNSNKEEADEEEALSLADQLSLDFSEMDKNDKKDVFE